MHNSNHYLQVEYQERGEVRPTLIVGLGGSGVYTARRLHQLIRERYNTEGLIRFVYLDTDQGAMAPEPNLAEVEADEVVLLSIAHPEQIVDEWRRNPDLHPYLEFLSDDVNVGLLRNADGAAGIRPIGRFGFHASFESVYPRLQRAVQEIMQVGEQVKALMATVPYEVKVLSGQPRIYIITSLCGGTGSGIYFDTALVLREILYKQNLDGELVGVFYLPSVFQHEAGISYSMREVIQANAYAALMELEYFCNPNHLIDETWEIKYRMIPPISLKEPLFDEAYLLESLNAAGRTLSSKQEAFEMAARSLLMDIGSPLGARARSAKRNSLAVIDAIRCAETNEPRLFASFAVASIAVPIKELTEYCALRVAYDNLQQTAQPVYELDIIKEAEEFLQANGFTENALRSRFTDELPEPDIRIQPQADLRPQIDRRKEQLQEYQQNLRLLAKGISKVLRDQFKERIQNRAQTIAREKSETGVAKFMEAVAQQLAKQCEKFAQLHRSCESDIQDLNEQLQQISSRLSSWERFNRDKILRERADRVERLLKKLRETYISAQIYSILHQLFCSDAVGQDSESLRQIVTRTSEQFTDASQLRSRLLAALEQRIQQIETTQPTTSYSLEQLAILRRHFNAFYCQHQDRLKEPLTVLLQGNTVYVQYHSGERHPVSRSNAVNNIHEFVYGIAQLVTVEIANIVRECANVMEFLRLLTNDASNDDRPYLMRKVEYLMKIAQPFWSASQPPGDVRFEEFLAVSVPLSSNDFRREDDARELARVVEILTNQAGIAAERVKDGYPFALTIMNRTYGARAYYLRDLAELEHSYFRRVRNAQVRAHLHLDARFIDLPNLSPVAPDARLWWAVALATGYIAVIDNQFYFDLEQTDRFRRPKYITQRTERLVFGREEYDQYLRGVYDRCDESNALLGQSYEVAFRAFARDCSKIKQVSCAFEQLRELVDAEAFDRAYNDYLELLRQRANEFTGTLNPWREEREALLGLQLEANKHVLSNSRHRYW